VDLKGGVRGLSEGLMLDVAHGNEGGGGGGEVGDEVGGYAVADAVGVDADSGGREE
jgi:hypothetical protein